MITWHKIPLYWNWHIKIHSNIEIWRRQQGNCRSFTSHALSLWIFNHFRITWHEEVCYETIHSKFFGLANQGKWSGLLLSSAGRTWTLYAGQISPPFRIHVPPQQQMRSISSNTKQELYETLWCIARSCIEWVFASACFRGNIGIYSKQERWRTFIRINSDGG